MEEFEVTYIVHSLFEEFKKQTEIVTKVRLIKLLEQGLITVLEAKRIMKGF